MKTMKFIYLVAGECTDVRHFLNSFISPQLFVSLKWRQRGTWKKKGGPVTSLQTYTKTGLPQF